MGYNMIIVRLCYITPLSTVQMPHCSFTFTSFHILLQTVLCCQSVLASDELGKLGAGEGASLADHMALTIGQ